MTEIDVTLDSYVLFDSHSHTVGTACETNRQFPPPLWLPHSTFSVVAFSTLFLKNYVSLHSPFCRDVLTPFICSLVSPLYVCRTQGKVDQLKEEYLRRNTSFSKA